ncbi:MAG TPA: hypothetical protein VJ696_02175 [Rhodanobacteraceae bacterium]|nr:hypothetical protein [Rhodanobacteraceae bacterium]
MNPFALAGCFLAAGLAASHAHAGAPGAHDFDFEIGTWKTHVKRLAQPLGGSQTWVELEGTSVVRKILDGRANLVELDIAGPSGRIQGVSLRLFRPASGDWSLNYSSLRSGMLSPPLIGSFKEGRGEFYGRDTMDGRDIDVRFVITCPARDECRFEQAFSADGRKTWEVNWIATDTRVSGEPS